MSAIYIGKRWSIKVEELALASVNYMQKTNPEWECIRGKRIKAFSNPLYVLGSSSILQIYKDGGSHSVSYIFKVKCSSDLTFQLILTLGPHPKHF